MHSIRTRLTVLFVTLSSVVAVLIAGYFIYAFVAKNQADVASYRQLLNDQFDREIRQQTEGLVSSLDAIYAAQQAGTLTEQEARALAIATIKSDRYDDGKGYFFADDKQTGVCVAHATLGSKVEGKRRIDDQDENGDYYMRKIFAAAAESDAGGFSNFSFPKPGESVGTPKRGFSMEFKPYGWIICTGTWIDYIDAAAQDYNKQAQAALHHQILVSLLLLLALELLIVFAGSRLAGSLSRRIARATDILHHFSEGDYRIAIDTSAAGQDELGSMVRMLATLKGSMCALIERVQAAADDVSSHAEQIQKGSEQSAQASSQTAGAITNVASAAEEQNASVKEAAQSIAALTDSMTRVSDNVRQSASAAKEAQESSEQGSQTAADAMSGMQALQSSVEETSAAIDRLGTRSKTIGQITDTITGIAQQTSLLALNAAIEAARAGTAGRGFAVVADEIGKLASESQDAAQSIAAIIADIQKDTAAAVGQMRQGKELAGHAAQTAKDAGSAFASVTTSVTHASAMTADTTERVRNAAAQMQSIQAAVAKVEEMSQAIAQQTESVSAATEEQSASVEEMAANCQQLAAMADKLRNAVAQFRCDKAH